MLSDENECNAPNSCHRCIRRRMGKGVDSMRKALVCTHCFDLTWTDSLLHVSGLPLGPARSWWTCTECVPLGGFEGEDA